MTRSVRIVLGILAFILALGVIYKLRLAPEWTVFTGSVKDRQEICRSVYKKAPWRATWALNRLLGDRDPAVQVTAIEALARSPELHERFVSRIEEMAALGDIRVRARALEYIFKHPSMLSPKWVEHTSVVLQDVGLRNQHPELLSFYLSAELDRGEGKVIAWMLDLLAMNALEDTRPWETVLRYPDLLHPFRKELVTRVEAADEDLRSFVGAALAAAGEEIIGTAETQEALERFTVEMEWANRIHPNFHVDVHEGKQCLSLGEGAGGYAVWRSNPHHTVDVGQAQLTFTLAKSGYYQIWCQSWFSDKCGNHALLYIDDTWFKGDSWNRADSTDVLRSWHWKRLESRIRLSEGRHTLTVKAADDGLFHDRLALLPAKEVFDSANLPPTNCLYDPAVPCSISITPESQSQSRGSIQTVTAWVRRNSPNIPGGDVALTVPEPFRIVGDQKVAVVFAEDSPIASADFRIALPADCSGSEVRAEASFVAGGSSLAVGALVLGVNYDWYATGPLSSRDALCVALLKKTKLSTDDLKVGWQPYPANGYDKYRRLNFENAYGQTRGAYIFLYTEIEITQAGSYRSLLTIDDKGYVFLGDQRVAGRRTSGVSEGSMMVDDCELQPGRYPVFAWVYQSSSSESRSGRGQPNHWVFKWLLRESQQRPSPNVRSVQVQL
ncbi:MAG: hypothetical protein ACI8W8_002462 [Rhodothermales bacterium]|jgi:hypothetical protein